VRLQVEDPEPLGMLVGLQPMASPVEGETDVERLTVAVKPFWEVTVTVNVPVLVAGLKTRLAEFIVNGKDEPLV